MISWSTFCDAPGRAIDQLAHQDRVYIRAGRAGRVDLVLTKIGLASDKLHHLTVSVSALRDGKGKARGKVQAAIERGEVVKLSRFRWAEAVIERCP
jgi:hypothetical protein